MTASLTGKADAVKVLLDMVRTFMPGIRKGQTPLMRAAARHAEVVDLLVQRVRI
jgi:hypothetical protein